MTDNVLANGPWAHCDGDPFQATPTERKEHRSTISDMKPTCGPWAGVDQVQATPVKRKVREPSVTPLKPTCGPWGGIDLASPPSCKRHRRTYTSLQLSDVVVSAARSPGVKCKEKSKAAVAGSDKKQVKELWQGEGRCICQCGTVPCHRDLPFEDLYNFCVAWHDLSNDEKWFLIRTQFVSTKDGEEHRSARASPVKVSWHMQGVPLCFKNFAHLLRVGPMTLRGYLKDPVEVEVPNACELQGGGQRGRPRFQSNIVDYFFMELYNSAGEPLAKTLKTNASHMDTDICLSSNPWLNAKDNLNPDEEDQEWDPSAPDVSRLNMLTLAACGAPAVGLRERYIQHTTMSILYWQFLATWETIKEYTQEAPGKGAKGQRSKRAKEQILAKPPCFGTFKTRYIDVWSKYIKIRQPTEHAQCNTCFQLQQIILDNSKPLEVRRDAATQMHKHHREQYTDRVLYWNLRLASQVQGDILVIIIDAMDKAKFAWPRWPWDRRPKDLEALHRPRMDFTAVLAHGWTAGLFMSPETVSHGSDFCIDALCRTIAQVHRINRSKGRAFPKHLVIQSDNTVAQAKNQWVTLFLAWLVHDGLFETTTLNFLRFGHTHEDIDQFFSLCVSLILKCHHYQEPSELLKFLEVELRPKFQAKQEELFTDVVSGVYDWQAWLLDLNRTISNCFANRKGQEAPHSFCFKRAASLRPAERRWGGGALEHRSNGDVYTLVKDYMCSPDLRQAPAVVIPVDRKTRTPLPQTVAPRIPMGAEKIKGYTTLAMKCGEYGLPRAKAGLEAFMFDFSYTLPELEWMQDPFVKA